MLFKYLKQNQSAKMTFVLRTYLTGGVQKNILRV